MDCIYYVCGKCININRRRGAFCILDKYSQDCDFFENCEKLYCKLYEKRTESEFIKITDNYGYSYEISERVGEKLYIVWRIKNGKAYYEIAGFKKKKLAIKECEYLEKLNEAKFRK